MLRKYGTKEHSNGLLPVAMKGVEKMGKNESLVSF
jgi:Na+/H+-dicarboxylate symporter